MPPATPVLLFDGHCNLCHSTVQWVLARDRRQRFRFASLQSAAARRVLSEARVVGPLPDSMVLIDARGVHTGSTAALRAALQLGFPTNVLATGLLLPRPLRDAAYRTIARRRYRWFGRRDSCPAPTPELEARFLDADEPPVDAPPSSPAAAPDRPRG